MWLPVGVSIAFLYFRGLGFWPAVLVGDLLVNNYAALPVGTAVAQTAGNVLEVLIATELLVDPPGAGHCSEAWVESHACSSRSRSAPP